MFVSELQINVLHSRLLPPSARRRVHRGAEHVPLSPSWSTSEPWWLGGQTKHHSWNRPLRVESRAAGIYVWCETWQQLKQRDDMRSEREEAGPETEIHGQSHTHTAHVWYLPLPACPTKEVLKDSLWRPLCLLVRPSPFATTNQVLGSSFLASCCIINTHLHAGQITEHTS